jgi:hypothetical protein
MILCLATRQPQRQLGFAAARPGDQTDAFRPCSSRRCRSGSNCWPWALADGRDDGEHRRPKSDRRDWIGRLNGSLIRGGCNAIRNPAPPAGGQ